MSVLVVSCRAEQSRYTAFDEYWGVLRTPEGSKKIQLRSSSIARSRNVACEAMLDGGFDHLLFIDDDQAFGPDLLLQLLSREKDIISGTYLIRRWPFHVCAFWKWLDPVGDKLPAGLPLVLRQGMKGTFPIVAAGAGALLISRKVLETVSKPWFKLAYNEPDMIAEDLGFFLAATNAGFQPWLDLDCIVGHMVSQAVWPYREGADWLTVIATGGEQIPIPTALELLKIQREERESKASPIVIP